MVYESFADEFEKLAGDYFVSGAVLGALDQQRFKVLAPKFTVQEELPETDPWKAVIKSGQPLSADELKQFHAMHTNDPDKAGVPYYFMLRTGGPQGPESVMFSDEFKCYPLHQATEAGLAKGIPKKYLDFKG